jgi:pyruvate, water dikinase
MQNIVALRDLTMKDLPLVGGKNASLGEMIRNLTTLKIRVPEGFATTTHAYRHFLKSNNLDEKIYQLLNDLDVTNIRALKKASAIIKSWILKAKFSPDFIADITTAYTALKPVGKALVAVRSSATSEDLPNASFAGQQDSYLNICGIKEILRAIQLVYASLFNQRAIVYRVQNGFAHQKVAISVGVQRMVRSDLAVSGVMFTLDTESGFDEVVFINANYGYGETVVQGKVNPDEFYVYKKSLAENKFAVLQRNLGEKAIKMIAGPRSVVGHATKTIPVTAALRAKFTLTDKEVMELGRQAMMIEKHYAKPMDIEWGKDGLDGKLYIVQARPETVRSLEKGHGQSIEHFSLSKKGEVLFTGHSVGQRIGQGKARVILNVKEMRTMQDKEVLIADKTDPDWEPIMKRAAAIVTNRGGRTCHAAIVARELGIPAVVGCNDATTRVKNGTPITVSCAEGEIGYVYRGLLPIEVKKIAIDKMPKIPVKLCLNLADPQKAFSYQFLPNYGVGLARLEFIISNMIGIHPGALLNFKKLPKVLQHKIALRTAAYANPVEYYIERLREGVATIAAAFYPKPVIVRLSDFKSNEYANLLGGELFEPKEENPMIGFRGVSRYVNGTFVDCFALECEAMKRVRDQMGLTNVEIMLPFVRTPVELKQVVDLLATYGLKRGKNGLRIIVMCEVPSSAIIPKEFLKYCDGFSIGSNDLTQLTLGLDRDSNLVANLFDERNAAVKFLLDRAIKTCKDMKKYVGICGQAPSDYPDFARWLMDEGIMAISLNPDTIVKTWLYLAGK